MMSMFLSRARLKPDQSTAALAPILITRQGLTPHAGKALVWSLFADGEDRKRDFLWRWDGGRPGRLVGEFLILSARRPVDTHNLFDLDTKDFAPVFASGDRLAFRLRANPVVRHRWKGRSRSTKHDVVMHGLRDHDKGSRADARQSLVTESGLAWLERQLGKVGAEVVREAVRIDGYQKHRISDGKGLGIEFSSLDFDGLLTVGEPHRFAAAVMDGFGSSKAYGFGLMLLRRA